ncbi:metal-dependent phosphohydrolase, partial [Streptomyces sp. NPDC059979]|uniref:metal-dependent phosphohydrolase n=1 Tax=Streptomyces sp. NPDC059979 TaxID=3347021 RepID=UPI00369BE970
MPYVASVLELMDLLRGCSDDHGLRTAALLRRSHPADKELQLAGLVHDLGRLLRPSERAGRALLAAEAVRPLLGERVARLVRLLAPEGGSGGGREGACDDGHADADAVATLRQAGEAAAASGLDAGVLEDWRPLLELVAARAHPAVPAGNAIDPLGS